MTARQTHTLSADFLAPFTFNPAQAAFIACGERFSFYVGGVGAGKTFAGAVRALARAIDQPGSLGLIGAPTYPMLRDSTARTLFALLEEAREATTERTETAERKRSVAGARERAPLSRKALPQESAAPLSPLDSVPSVISVVQSLFPYTYNKSEGHLRLANGSEILLRSLDEPDRVRGLNLAWFWLDEAPLCGYYAWQILKGRLRQQGFATAGWATGTPHGRDGFARDFETLRKPHHILYRASTLDNAAHLPDDYIADLGYTGALYDQEVLGLFTAFEGLVYAFQADTGQADATGHVREAGGFTTESTEHTERSAEEQGRGSASVTAVTAGSVVTRWKAVIGGVDWGYTNPTAAVIFGIDGDGRAHQLDEWYQRRAPLDAVVLPALCDLTRRYGVTTWYCGPDEPEHIAALQAALIRAGVGARARAADDAVRPGIQTVTRLLALREDGTRGLTVAARCVHTIAEYLSYQYEAPATGSSFPPREGGQGGRSGQSVSELPLKANDHAMDATRYALHTALGQPATTRSYLATYLGR